MIIALVACCLFFSCSVSKDNFRGCGWYSDDDDDAVDGALLSHFINWLIVCNELSWRMAAVVDLGNINEKFTRVSGNLNFGS